MSLLLLVSRLQRFLDVEAAVPEAARLVSALEAVCPLRRLWVASNEGTEPFDPRRLASMLDDCEVEPWRSPAGFTHIVSIHFAPGTPVRGTLLLRLGEAAPAGQGLKLALAIDAARFPSGAAELLAALRSCVETVHPEEASIGPTAWFDEGLAWATWCKGAASTAFRGVRMPCKAGEICVAHNRAPEDESPQSREDAVRMRAALGERGAPSAEPLAMSDSLGDRVVHPAARPAKPPERTVELRDIFVAREGLPFAAAGPEQPVAAAASAVAAAKPRPWSGTEDVDTAKLRALLVPFSPPGRSPTTPPIPPLSAPQLTLEQYAQLRAALAVRGEDDRETWNRFGIVSVADKQALQGQFAARFRENGDDQARFVALLQRYRGESAKASVPPEPDDVDGTLEFDASAMRAALPFPVDGAISPPAANPGSESRSLRGARDGATTEAQVGDVMPALPFGPAEKKPQ